MHNPFSLIGKTILVTGASSGIGRSIAIECSKMGAKVILTGRNQERLQETLLLLQEGQHQHVISDISSEEEIINLVDQLPTLNGCVHSAGVLGLTPIQAITKEKIDSIERINLHAPILLTKHLIKKWAENLNRHLKMAYRLQQAHENMPIIANYERNANTMRYHLISVRMAIIKMSTKTNSG